MMCARCGEPGALEAAAAAGCAVCLMHMQGSRAPCSTRPRYEDVVNEVRAFLTRARSRVPGRGHRRERVVVDPGFGFGKTLAHNLQLLRQLPELVADGLPVLVGMSRKSMLGALTGPAA